MLTISAHTATEESSGAYRLLRLVWSLDAELQSARVDSASAGVRLPRIPTKVRLPEDTPSSQNRETAQQDALLLSGFFV